MKHFKYIILLLFLYSCKKTKTTTQNSITEAVYKTETPLTLTLEQANNLVKLPLACVNTEYPNKLGQTLGSDQDLKSPKVLHPSFYGCFDWHSAVHGHWSLVSLLRQFPNLEQKNEVENWLKESITKKNIAAEVAYFNTKNNSAFERTYGWAWLLKLDEELQSLNTELSTQLLKNLQPLTQLIVSKYIEFLPKLNYPIRVGEHTNTAFGLSFAYDYAVKVKNDTLKNSIIQSAKKFYLNDTNCPLEWEPSGYDFLSPCLEEAALMKRVLSKTEFNTWLIQFLPELQNQNFSIDVGKVSDREDGKLVHLDGVNFSRAWSLNYIANGLPKYKHLKYLANTHIKASLPSIVNDSYEGGHWLGSFAIYALQTSKK